MAKYDVTFSCGHRGTVSLFGPTKERDRKIEWYETEAVCPDCYREQKQAERDKQRKAAGDAATAYLSTRSDLPTLIGSDKQIAWANTIRATILKDAAAYFEGIKKSQKDDEAMQLVKKYYPTWYADLCAQASAKWWIDNRSQSQEQVLGGSNPIAMFGMVMHGSTPAQTALSLWDAWIAKQPEIIAYRERLQVEIERQKAEHEAAKEEYIKSVLSVLDGVDWEKAVADDAEVINHNGHTIEINMVNGDFLRVSKIDGTGRIDFNGEFAAWIDQRHEVQELNERITDIWHGIIKNPLKTFVVGDREGSIKSHTSDPDYKYLTVKSRDGRTAKIIMWGSDEWEIGEINGKFVPDGVRKSDHAIRIISDVRRQMEA